MTIGWTGRGAVQTLIPVVWVGMLAGCSETGPPLPASVAPDTIVIKNFAFNPGGIAVAPGTAITVINQDPVTHTLTAVDKLFDSGSLAHARPG